MAKLTDTQLIVLSNAAARDDWIAVVPAKVNKAFAAKVGASLLARKLMREFTSSRRSASTSSAFVAPGPCEAITASMESTTS